MCRKVLVIGLFSLLGVFVGLAQTCGPGKIYYGGIQLQFSGRISTPGTCGPARQPASGVTQIQCEVSEGAAGTIDLTASRTPAGRISGRTDAEGGFSVPLPWPGAMVTGRLLSPDGRPLALQEFSLNLIPKGAAISDPEDIGGFTITVPGYLKAKVTQFSTFSLLGTTRFLLRDVQLEEVELPWSADRPLTWDDFQGDLPEDARERGEAAEIHMYISWSGEWRIWFDRVSGKWKACLATATTKNAMDRANSWVDPDHKTPGLLNHEQKHFDLNEVYRGLLDTELQKLMRNLEAEGNTKEQVENALEKKANEVVEKFQKKCDEVQRRYDDETDHGMDADKQEEWDKKIHGWLLDPGKAPKP